MKLVLIFALFGVNCCLAVPFCTEEQLQKCFENEAGPTNLPTEEEFLEKFCRETQCFLGFYDRCGTDKFGPKIAFPINGYHRVVADFCYKESPIRQKFLKNAKCIRSLGGVEELPELLKKCGIDDLQKKEFCRKIPAGMECATEYIISKCGKDAGDVFRVGALPYIDPYDCLSSRSF